MQLFYSPQIDSASLCTLDAEESRHAVRVLRHGVGDMLYVADGRGSIYRCRIVAADASACVVCADEAVQSPSAAPQLTLAVAPTKNPSRMEWLVEKAVEVGISTLQLLQCDHSERTFLKTDRLQKLAVSAMKQSLHAVLPEVRAAVPMRQWLSEAARLAEGGNLFIAHCEDDQPRTPLSTVLRPARSATILIGPEGDFSDEEIATALSLGFRPVSLGASRLRTETAALYAAVAFSIINTPAL